MFFDKDEDLDYEEGDEILEGKASQTSRKCTKNSSADLSGADDWFLQIDVNENEKLELAEKAGEKIPKNNEKSPPNTKKGNEKFQESKKNNFKSGQVSQKKEYFRKKFNRRSGLFHQQNQMHNNLFRGLALRSGMPFLKYNFGSVPSNPLKNIKYQSPKVCFNKNAINNYLGLPLGHLMKNQQQILSNFWSHPNLLHQTNLMNLQRNFLQLETLFPTVSPNTVSKQTPDAWPLSISQLQTQTQQPSLNKSTKCNKEGLNFALSCKEKENPFAQPQLLLGGLTSNFDQSGENLLEATYNALQESEKEIIKKKKEERLKRFMKDDQGKQLQNFTVKKPSTEVLAKEKPIQGCEIKKTLVPNENQKKIVSLGNTDLRTKTNSGNHQTIKPKLNKQLLIKKKNPFETFDLSFAVVKKEKIDETQPETFGNSNSSGYPSICETKQKDISVPNCRCQLRSVNCENGNDGKVTFVRTISKSFEELGLSKTLLGNCSQTLNNLIHSKADLSAPEKSILTGCIVKVYNVPKTMVTNDVIELCNSIGRVLEIKLNLPKENSAVIRFAKSEHAEHFYSLYHGQKYGDNFLNVIIV